jgi:4-diphosphocytidyl-2-C-methyl-D-erythritol kinase
MSGAARVAAQAKVNLFLRVLAREANGYHQLETLFCRLDLADDVVVRTGVAGRSLDCIGDRLPAGGLGPVTRNLAWRAAVGFAEATGWPRGFAIEIDKRIPVGGGLGGGSADAGAVLRALNALAPAPLAPPALLALAASLGADVPFLAAEAPLALGWGRGERLLALPPLPSRRVWLRVFDVGIPTADAFRWLDAGAPPASPPMLLTVEALSSWEHVARIAHNDFEAVVAARVPSIGGVLAAARGSRSEHVFGTDGLAFLTGSGSTVVLIPSSEVQADDGPLPPGLVETRTAERVAPVERIG